MEVQTQLPDPKDAMKVISPAFISINQRGQALKNKLEDLQGKAMDFIKLNNAALYTEIIETQAELERIDAAMEEIGEHVKVWEEGPTEV